MRMILINSFASIFTGAAADGVDARNYTDRRLLENCAVERRNSLRKQASLAMAKHLLLAYLPATLSFANPEVHHALE